VNATGPGSLWGVTTNVRRKLLIGGVRPLTNSSEKNSERTNQKKRESSLVIVITGSGWGVKYAVYHRTRRGTLNV